MYSNKISMEFIEGSEGIYRPIRVLFGTPIYARAMQICWHILSYRLNVAIMMELFRLQQKNQIPSTVTAEDMINLILEESKCSLREGLWEFEMEGFDDEVAKPLLKLAYAVNVSNKMRDVECEAMILLDSPEAVPPNFQHPRVISTAQDYARMLIAKEQEAPKQLCPSDVVLEVVPRVLQAFLGLPDGPHLSMPSQQLSKMSVGVTKAVTDGVCSALTTEHQATFSRNVRDEMVLSVLTQIGQTWSPDVLVNKVDCLVPLLLSEIVQVAVGQICALFQPHGPKVLTVTTVTTPVQEDSDLTVTEQQPKPNPETDCAVLPPPPAGPLSTNDVQIREDLNEKPSSNEDLEPPAKEPAFGAVPPPLSTPAEPTPVGVQTREDVNPKPSLEKDPAETTTRGDSNVAPLPPSPPSAKHPSKVQAREAGNVMLSPKTDPDTTGEPGCAAVPTEHPSFRIQANGDVVKKPCLEMDPSEPSTEADSAVVQGALAPLNGTIEPLVIITSQNGLTASLAEKEQPNVSQETVPVVVSSPPTVTIVTTPVQEDFNLTVTEQQPKPGPETDCAVLPPPPAGPLSTNDVQTREDLNEKPSPNKDLEPPAKEPAFGAVPPPLTPPAEPTPVEVQTREDVNPKYLLMHGNKISMEFIEGSEGIYRPIRVLFDTSIYARAMQICWHILSYRLHVAIMMELFRLQQKNQIPSTVTAEDMINLIVEESKCSLREGLWEFEMEGFDDEEAKPLLKLAYAVNVSNKIRDIECEAMILLNSPEAVPPNFQHPRVISTAQDYARMLIAKEQEAPKQLCPSEVVLEVVPRVLQAFLGLPDGPHLSMPSQQLSKMSVGVTKAVTDGVCSALTTEHQATFSRNVRDEMVLSVLTQIGQTWSPDVLVNKVDCLVPLLLSEIVQVAVGQICALFQPHGPKVPTVTTVTTPVQEDSDLTVTEHQPKPSPETDCAVLPPPPAGPLSTNDVQIREDLNEKPSSNEDLEPPAKEPAFGAVPPPLSPPAEPTPVGVQTREDVNPKPSLEKDPAETTTRGDSNVVPLPPSPPSAKHPSKVQAREAGNVMLSPKTDPDTTGEPGCAAVPTEHPSFRIQANGDVVKKPCLEMDPSEPSTEADSAVVQGALAPLNGTIEPLVIITSQNGLTASLAEKEQPNVSQETVPVVVSSPPTVTIVTTPVQEDFNLTVTEQQPKPGPETDCVVLPPPPAGPLSTTDVQTREDLNEKPSQNTDLEPPAEEPAFGAVPPPLTPPAEPTSIRIQTRDIKKPCLEKEAAKPSTEAESAVFQGSMAPLNGTIESLVIITSQNGLTASLAEKEQPNVSQETVPVVVSSPPAGQTSTTQPSCITDVQEEEDNDTIPKPSRGVVPASAAALNLPLEPVVIVKVYSEVRKTKKRRSQRFFRWLFKPLLCCFRASDRD